MNHKRSFTIGLLGTGALLALGWIVHELATASTARFARLPLILAPFPLVWALSRSFPAKRDFEPWSPALGQDALYFCLNLSFRVLVLVHIVELLRRFYQRELDFLTIHAVESWPTEVRLVASILIGDFLGWFSHVIRHKVPFLWHFHAVHHSQRQMNFFTDLRIHVLEYIIVLLITFIPMFMLQLAQPTVLFWGIVIQWHTLIFHANLETNYGFLRYVIVSPQSHRLHHSMLPEHGDRNFGVIFSIWDRLFGTLHPDFHTYPDTGIPDAGFPMEREVGDGGFRAALLAQFLYPFQRIFQPRRRSGTTG